MLWFDKEKKKKMDFIQHFRPTSKIQLIQVCMWFHKGDVEKAQQMFDFYTKNVDLPDTDPVPPSWMDNTKKTVTDILGWARENQDTIAQGYDFIRSLIQNRSLPPIGTDTPPSAPLPPINE